MPTIHIAVELGDRARKAMTSQFDSEQRINTRSSKNLYVASSQAANAWFPINPELLWSIQEKISANTYKNPSELEEDIKQDFALFTWMVGQCAQSGTQAATNPQPPSILNPANFVSQNYEAVVAKLKEIKPESVSPHILGDSSEFQVGRLSYSMTSASVAQALAENSNVDPNLAFSCALFRQLGLTLISWNYPHVYKRVMNSLKPEDQLDNSLTKMLGFSPAMLGLTIARRWTLAPELCIGMGDPVAEETVQESRVKAIGDTLEKICQIGEAFARANDPEHYPTAKADWDMAQNQVTVILGPNGFKKIKERIVQNCEFYSQLNPDLFNPPLDPQAISAPKTRANSALLSANIYVKQCTPGIQELLGKLYDQMDGQQVSKNCIDFLAKEIIPASGFLGGCIYLIEPDTSRLVPRLALGTVSINSFSPTNYMTYSDVFDPVVAAYKCKTPIMEENVQIGDRTISYVAGVIGDIQRAGVLYLELSEAQVQRKTSNVLGCFKAIRQALSDSLNLR
jgi:hypothetical protein